MQKIAPSVLRALRRHDLLSYQDVIADSLSPAVRIVTGKAAARRTPIGRSKFGGEPDLPDDHVWPTHEGRPLAFLGQIRMSDLPMNHLPSKKLPKRGCLWFWHDALGGWYQQYTRIAADWGYGFKITFEPGEQTALARRPFPEFPEPKIPKAKKLRYYSPPDCTPSPEVTIRYKPVWSIDHEALGTLFNKLERDDADEGWDRVLAFYREIHEETSSSGNHRLLGDIFEIGGSCLREDCHWMQVGRRKGLDRWAAQSGAKPATRRQTQCWQLLAILDTDEPHLNWVWGDAGRLCFFIREQDLAKCDFAKAECVLESA
ncbi:MAG: DUF1963 domain-containing protein [Planctomycetales bacterium]|nr:DUF1963 domain-containing protein [Planctomycetales bacterium]